MKCFTSSRLTLRRKNEALTEFGIVGGIHSIYTLVIVVSVNDMKRQGGQYIQNRVSNDKI